MKLFFYPVCPISNKVLILIKILNLEITEINISSRSQFLNIIKEKNIFDPFIPILEHNDSMIMGTNILFHLINLKFHHLPPILDQF
jgi:glutaredoxin 2